MSVGPCSLLLDIAQDTGVSCPTLALLVLCSQLNNKDEPDPEQSVPNTTVTEHVAGTDDDDEPVPQSNTQAAPPQSDTGIAPMLSATAINHAASTIMSGPSPLSSTISKGSKRNIGSLRNEAANIIRRAWYRRKLHSSLRNIFENAAATKFQSLYRAYCSRRAHREVVQQQRNYWVIARYAYHRIVDLRKVPVRHIVFLAARRIQLAWRRYRSHILLARQRRLRAAIRIQRFYRRSLFVRFMGTATERRVLHDRRTLAAIKIQSLCRGVLARKLAKSGACRQWNAEAGARLAPQQRRAR
ncbi:IQ calmodulin-binding protein, putative, partial [Bodo saltans]